MIVAEDGRELAADERGEIWVGGPTVISGYLDAPDLNRVAFVNGWFRTGDIGSLDRDGFLTLHGREQESNQQRRREGLAVGNRPRAAAPP